MQDVGAWRMLGGHSTRCHHMMWSPYLEEVPMLGHAGKEALKQFDWMCERVQPIESLLFVLYQLMAMQVWWMKA